MKIARRTLLATAMAAAALAQGVPETPFVDPKPRAEDAPKIDWLKKNATPIRTIDPADDDFADLQPLKKIIGDARVVQLGEQSHGDGATFYAKERLIRFLHEQMGFDVLAWESGFYDCEEMNQAIDSDMPPLEAAQKGVFGIWTRGGLMTPLFEYARSTLKTARPLRQTASTCSFPAATSKGFPRCSTIWTTESRPMPISRPCVTRSRRCLRPCARVW